MGSSEFPAPKGYLLEGEKVVEYSAEEAMNLSASPDHDNRGSQVFWSREGAQAHLDYLLNPEGGS
jgi:hypothetical protein